MRASVVFLLLVIRWLWSRARALAAMLWSSRRTGLMSKTSWHPTLMEGGDGSQNQNVHIGGFIVSSAIRGPFYPCSHQELPSETKEATDQA